MAVLPSTPPTQSSSSRPTQWWSDNDETHYRKETQHLTGWFSTMFLIPARPWRTLEVIGNHQIPGLPHFLWPHLVNEHETPVEDSWTKTILPQETEAGWTLLSAACELLYGLSGEHLVSQHPYVVWQLHSSGQKTLIQSGENCSGNCGMSSPRFELPVHWRDSVEEQLYWNGYHIPGKWTACAPIILGAVQKHHNKDKQTETYCSFFPRAEKAVSPPSCTQMHTHLPPADTFTHTLIFALPVVTHTHTHTHTHCPNCRHTQ